MTDSIKIEFPIEYSSQITADKATTLCQPPAVAAETFDYLIKNDTSCYVQQNSLIFSGFLIANLTAPETFTVKVTGLTNPAAPPHIGFTISTIS